MTTHRSTSHMLRVALTAGMLAVLADSAALAQQPPAAGPVAGAVSAVTGSVLVRRGANSVAPVVGGEVGVGDQIVILEGGSLSVRCPGNAPVTINTVGVFTFSGCQSTLPAQSAAAQPTPAPAPAPASTAPAPAPRAAASAPARSGGPSGATLGIIGGVVVIAAAAGGGGGGGGGSSSPPPTPTSP